MGNNPLRDDYEGDARARLTSRGWLIAAAVVLGLFGMGLLNNGLGFGGVIVLVAVLLGVAGLVGLAVRD